MLIDGIILGGITFVGWRFLFAKLPKNVKDFLFRHPLLLDAFETYASYTLIAPGTVTGLMAAGTNGLLTAFWQHLETNPEKFPWYHDSKIELSRFFESATKKSEKPNLQVVR